MPLTPPAGLNACNSPTVGYADFCATWPPQSDADKVPASTVTSIRKAVQTHLAHFPSGVQPGQLSELMRRPCMQRHCLHIFLEHGNLYAAAPAEMAPCERNASRGDSMRSPYCSEELRRKQPGVTIPDWWSNGAFPHITEWHFAAGLNLSSCAGVGIPGDHNYIFTRLRLQSTLRFLLRAYRRLHANGKLPASVELVICAGETPVNFGDYCFSGAQPVWSATTNEQAPLIPYVHWVQLPPRDTDLSVWDPSSATPDAWAGDTDLKVMRKQEPGLAKRPAAQHCGRHSGCSGSCKASLRSQQCTLCRCQQCAFCQPSPPPSAPPSAQPWSQRTEAAVFRGSLLRLNSYTWKWRREGPRRTPISAANWQKIGRTALVHLKSQHPNLLNIHMTGTGLKGHSDDLPHRLGIPTADWEKQDAPQQMPFEDQLKFKYAINAEGHGGWADRLYKMMLHGQLVLMQDLPARLWYEAPLRPWEDYVPVAAGWSNLSRAVTWARANDDAARRMATSAKSHMQEWMTPAAMFRYTEELLLGYAGLQQSPPDRPSRSVRFECREAPPDNQAPAAAPQTCWLPGRGKVCRGETHCYFEVNGQKHGSLFHASRGLKRSKGLPKERTVARARLHEVLSGRLPLNSRNPWGGSSRTRR